VFDTKFPAPCTTDSPQFRSFCTGVPHGIDSADAINVSAEIPSTPGTHTPSTNPVIAFAHVADAIVSFSTTFAYRPNNTAF
jgi:hypothetical protein